MSKEQNFKKLEMLNIEPTKTNKEIEQLNDSLTVVKEVRGELVKAYKENKTYKSTIEQLTAKVEGEAGKSQVYKKTIESLKSELDAYRARDAEVAKTAYKKRLESLSEDFKALGQEKTIEQLNKLGEDVIGEFESVTKLALKNKSEEQLDSVTVPTQAMPNKQPKAKQIEKLVGQDGFMKGLCQKLQSQQVVDGTDNKRTITL